MRVELRRVTVVTAVFGMTVLGAGVGGAQPGDADRGKLIQIGPAHGADGARPRPGRLVQPGLPEQPQAVSRYWIGVSGGPIPPEVLAHVDVDEGAGVMLRTVRPDSPAAEGGLKQYDIVTRANGDVVVDMRQLADAVGEVGEAKGRLTIELIREGRPMTLWVTPAERPAAPASAPEPGRPWFGGWQGGQPFGLSELPAGVSISVTQSGDTPAKITVRRGDESWELDANDQEAIAALPDDVRPLVERAVGGQSTIGGVRGFFDRPDLRERFGLGFGDRMPAFEPGDLQQRMLEMEQQVEQLRRRFGGFDEPRPEPRVEPDDVEIPAES